MKTKKPKIIFNCVGYHDRRTLTQRWLGSMIQRRRTQLHRGTRCKVTDMSSG